VGNNGVNIFDHYGLYVVPKKCPDTVTIPKKKTIAPQRITIAKKFTAYLGTFARRLLGPLSMVSTMGDSTLGPQYVPIPNCEKRRVVPCKFDRCEAIAGGGSPGTQECQCIYLCKDFTAVYIPNPGCKLECLYSRPIPIPVDKSVLLSHPNAWSP